jgi:hypothetical protein
MHTLSSLFASARVRAGLLSALSLLSMVLAGAAGHKWDA